MRAYDQKAINEFIRNTSLTPEPDTLVYMLKKGLKIKEVQVEMKNTGETVYFAGKAAITSLEVDAQFDDVCTLSMELQGIGALKVDKGA